MYYFLYLLSGPKGCRIGLSWCPEASHHYWATHGISQGYSKLKALSNGLPLELAWELKQCLEQDLAGKVAEAVYLRFRAQVQSREEQLPIDPPKFPDVDKLTGPGMATSAQRWRELSVFLKERCQGRQLLFSELQSLLQSAGREEWFLAGALQYLQEEGQIQAAPAVACQEQQQVCQRCGSVEAIHIGINALFKGLVEYTCEACIALGKSNSGVLLYSFASQEVKQTRTKPQIRLKFPLTPYQRKAAEGLVAFVHSARKHALVWAVCGAGKTEVSYSAVAEVLAQGGKVLFAIPRRDVVKELGERIRATFSNTTVVSIYGGSGTRFEQGEIYVATTHQVLRFKASFDLVVLDEVDAFPYRSTPMLHRAIEQSLKPSGKLIYMSATPEEELLDRGKQGQLEVFRIPRRHHGQPLPVPQVILTDQIGQWQQGKAKFPQTLIDLLWQTVEYEGRQMFVFVPSIEMTERVAAAINTALLAPPYGVEGLEWAVGVHAKDSEREVKVAAFSRGDFPIVVTTSILERGVTVERTNALVLFADWERVLDWGTLVQMAGRVGRTTDCPDGKVWFVGSKVTKAMQVAKLRIEEMNRCVD